MFYKCIECGCIHHKVIMTCDACNKPVIKIETINKTDIIRLIRDYSWRKIPHYSDAGDYWELQEYLEEKYGIDYSDFDDAFKEAENQGIVVKRELIYYPE